MDSFEEINKNILYLDDEIENLESFSLIFMEYFNIHTAQNSQEALKVLEEHDIHVFITDQRMPEVTGLEFLKKIRPMYPHIVCMIVSGYADTEVVIKALNEAGIYQYIAKPWKMEEFKMAIDNAFEKYELRSDNKKLIKDLKETNKQLANKVDQLDLYIYRASHDIKGYLTRFIGLCLTGEVEFRTHDNQVNEYFKLMHKEAQNMSRTLQNHLLLNSIETGKIRLQKTNINNVIKGVFQSLKEQENMQPEGVVNVENLLNDNIKLVTDTLLIETIIFQLLHNAFLFAKENCKVSLVIKEMNSALIIIVKDNGIGIEEDIQGKIYDQFFRGTNKSTGNGLGLYIVNLAVEKLFGTIKLESQHNAGATFTIQIPNSFS